MSAVQGSNPEKQGLWRPDFETRFKSGVSGNPGGVKKGQVFVSECYKRLLLLNPQELAEYRPVNAAEAMALRQIVTGIFGNEALPSVKEITDRTEGKAAQKVDVSANVNSLVIQTDLAEIQAIATQFGKSPEQVAADVAKVLAAK